jgi:HlyD family secretion protein
MRKILTFLVVVAVLGAGAYFGAQKFKPCLLDGSSAQCSTAKTAEAPVVKEVPPPAVTVVAAAPRAFTDRLFVSGTLVAREEALVAAQIDGLTIVELDAEDGDNVKAGQVLAKLDRSQLDALAAENAAAIQRADASIQQAQSQIDQAQAQVTFAAADYDRAQKLGGQVIAASTIDQRQTNLRTAQAQLGAAQHALAASKADRASRDAELKELQVRISRTVVKAPVDGIVSRRTARLGATASGAGDPLFRIIGDGAIDLEADVPEQSMARLALEMPVKIDLAGPGKPVEGKVRLISQEVDKVSRTGKVRIALDAASTARVGAFASGMVSVATSQGLGVPSTAVVRDAKGESVLVVKDNIVQARKVTTGIVEGDWVEAKDGLAPDDKVIARAAAFLRPGDRVTPVAAANAAMNAQSVEEAAK